MMGLIHILQLKFDETFNFVLHANFVLSIIKCSQKAADLSSHRLRNILNFLVIYA